MNDDYAFILPVGFNEAAALQLRMPVVLSGPRVHSVVLQ